MAVSLGLPRSDLGIVSAFGCVMRPSHANMSSSLSTVARVSNTRRSSFVWLRMSSTAEVHSGDGGSGGLNSKLTRAGSAAAVPSHAVAPKRAPSSARGAKSGPAKLAAL